MKAISAVLIALSVLMVPVALASGDGPDDGKGSKGSKSKKCHPQKVAGSYVLSRESTHVGMLFRSIQQLELEESGNVGFFSSLAPVFMVTSGTSIRSTGSWKCIAKDRLIITGIGEVYQSVQATDSLAPFTVFRDLIPWYFLRFTGDVTVVDQDTLMQTQVVNSAIRLDQDPLDPNAVLLAPKSRSLAVRVFKRIRPLMSDLD